ncbi:hypothetical protein HYH02_013542 [Chlamydomonas schloesseri]|uniref:Mediator complex subunit 18 n=1 Tax=Chlamydomonas schloesseri TaxID=2026947 RepID=A0A835SW65_9CHLO|nr:hypothetical protein HYH02_013542 [Chlamydomonas schloesseri]|eukprot:KAG2431013.1 hypothetical protein HYH02_013542 [Chlamydomonas schloesseri]
MSVPGSGAGGGGGGGGPAGPPLPASQTECRAVGMLERVDQSTEFANLLRSLCASYCSHATHSMVLRMPLPPGPNAPPGGTWTSLRLTRRLGRSVVQGGQGGGGVGKPPHPFLDDPPERWEVRHEGPPLEGPALNALPAAMREVSDAACYGAGAPEFFKVLGGKLEYEQYREGNEYSIIFHGHEIKVVLAMVYSLNEPGVLRDATSVRRVGGGGLSVEASLLVPEGRHYEGANVLGAFGAQLVPYVRLVRAEVPLPPRGQAAAGVAGAGAGGAGAAGAGPRRK